MNLVIYKAGFYKFIIKLNSASWRNYNKIQTEINEPTYISNELTQENSANYLGTQYFDKIFSV